jgi:DNA-binding NtrC family response regulator
LALTVARNVRELQNIVERAVINSKGPVLHVCIAELITDTKYVPRWGLDVAALPTWPLL